MSAASFIADDAAPLLGSGPVRLQVLPGTVPQGAEQAAYEAAVIDQLVKAGYDTLAAPGADAQIVEILIKRVMIAPAEQKRSPVSGSMSVGVSNRGTSTGIALGVDFTDPRSALLSTRMEIRIRDAANGQTLWEGRAQIATREGSKDWGEQEIAARLAAAMFEGFPAHSWMPR